MKNLRYVFAIIFVFACIVGANQPIFSQIQTSLFPSLAEYQRPHLLLLCFREGGDPKRLDPKAEFG
jgi:hypothetical protein